MKAATILMVFACVLLGSLTTMAAEKPQPLTDEKAKEIVKAAPKLPAKLDLDLKLKLIDYIDCMSDADPHGFMDQGTSKVVTGPAGKYRVTASHRHAFFSYRFRSAGKDEPVLIVIEYPDDARRDICFFTHESGLSGRSNIDWSLETGVYTGFPLPLTKKMQYHTFIMYPQDEWPAVIVANWTRFGSNGAAARIWVYAIQGGLPKLKINAPAPRNQRVLGHYNSLHFLPTRFHFGLRSPRAVKHMLDYCEYIGVNQLSWTVVYNNSWGVSCKIPSFDGGDKNEHLDEVLRDMDMREGMGFMAGFYLGDGFKIGGRALGSMEPQEAKAAIIKGLDEFIDRYGKFKSLRGVILGAQYGTEWFRKAVRDGIGADLVKAIKAKRPDLQVATYIGGPHLHREYFYTHGDRSTDKSPSAWQVISGWEQSGKPWSQYIGEQAGVCWREWNNDPAVMNKIPGLTVYEQLQPDDHYIFNLYAQQPRALIYYDLERSQKRSDLIGSPHAAMWNTHYEGWFGLHPNVNFWYLKLWVAPDFLPPEPLSMAPFANALALRDRMTIVPGSWNNKYFGHEASVRKFAKAFRELPTKKMNDYENLPVDTVKARWVRSKGKYYVCAVNRTPFLTRIEIEGKKIDLQPYAMVSVDGNAPLKELEYFVPKVAVQPCAEYREFVEDRIAGYVKLCGEVKALNAAAVPDAYTKAADEAEKLLGQGKYYAADIALGAGLVNEMQLRKRLLSPPELKAPKLAKAPPLTGDLDAWPKAASDIKAEGGEYIAGHLYFPNSWTGPKDLSVRLRLGHDGVKLYIGAEIRDNKLAANDGVTITFSKAAYMDWKAEDAKMDIRWSFSAPVDKDSASGKSGAGLEYTLRKTPAGYVIEGSAPLEQLGVKAGGGIGFLLSVSDTDGTPNQKTSGWARKQAMLVPHSPTFSYWSDARTCGRLVLGE